MTKQVMLTVRITEKMAEQLDAEVERLNTGPGELNRANLVRWIIKQYLEGEIA